MDSLTFLLLFLIAWVPCAIWLGRSNWRETETSAPLERVAGTAWLALIGGGMVAGAGLLVVALAVLAVSAVL
jgi:hypothetical protein